MRAFQIFFFFFFFLRSALKGAERCIAALHNSLWRGQRMRVERAKSNDADRTKTNDAERQRTFLKKFEESTAAKSAMAKEAEVAKSAAAAALPLVVERPKRDPEEREEEKRLLKKKRKLEKKKTREEERKIRVRPVADVAKATPWDAVLGHTWEERKEKSSSGFSLLAAVGQQVRGRVVLLLMIEKVSEHIVF